MTDWVLDSPRHRFYGAINCFVLRWKKSWPTKPGQHNMPMSKASQTLFDELTRQGRPSPSCGRRTLLDKGQNARKRMHCLPVRMSGSYFFKDRYFCDLMMLFMQALRYLAPSACATPSLAQWREKGYLPSSNHTRNSVYL